MSILIRIIALPLLSLAMAGTALAQSSTTVPQTTTPRTMTSPPAQATGSAASSSPTVGGLLTRQEQGQVLSSDIIGTSVVDEEGNELGQVSDLVMNEQQQVTGAVISVGGFLGLGSKSVGLPWQALRIEQRKGKSVAVVGMSEQQLADAPVFKTLAQIEAEQAAQAAQQQAPAAGGYAPKKQ